MNTAKAYIKGRSAQMRPVSRLEKPRGADEQLYSWVQEESDVKMKYIAVKPKTIVNSAKSPDFNFAYSLNPFQGPEHGRVYSSARNAHNYWGYSGGIDVEQTVLIKQNAASLLTKRLRSKSWEANPIMLSGNTDCYQPIEKKLGITRELLKVFWRYRHPVQIITKNDLILRDLDYLKLLASENLVQVAISVTSMDDDLRSIMEPRTSTIGKRLNAIKILTDHGIPVVAMLAPIIPNINDHEIFNMVQAVANAGAYDVKYVLAKLNGDVASIFKDWARENFPDRAGRIIKRIENGCADRAEDSRFGTRMRGEGVFAEMIAKQFKLAKLKHMTAKPIPKLNTELHASYKVPQLQLFK